MWPFSRRALKDELCGLKNVRINGFKFTIKKLNPLIDFPTASMPQIFADQISRRKTAVEPTLTPEKLAKMQREMYQVVQAGVVKPEIIPVGSGENKGKEGGITVEDLFRADVGHQLYLEILCHSLNRFKGIRGVFFSIRLKYALYIAFQQNMGSAQAPLFSMMAS